MIANSITGGPAFWTNLAPLIASNGGVAHCNDGALQYAALEGTSAMRMIVRTSEELFSDTVKRVVAGGGMKAAINGNQFDVTTAGKTDAFVGHDPDSAMLVINGTFHVSQGENKEEVTTIGIGFT